MFIFISEILFVIALSLDAFFCSFAYGTNQVKISFTKAFIISMIGSSLFAFSLMLGSLIQYYIPQEYLVFLSFFILFSLGIYKFIDGLKQINNKEYISLISMKETMYLSVVLTLDGMVAGLGAGMDNFNLFNIVILSFVIGILALVSGNLIGQKLTKNVKYNIAWISGIILILIAFTRI